VELAAIDRSLALVATTQPHARLVQVVRHYRQALDPDGEEPDPTEPHVVVTLGLEDLLGSAARPGAAATGFGQVLSAATARWLACDAQITRILLDPDGLPLDVGRAERVVPAHLRRAVELRDRHCGVVESAERRLRRPDLVLRRAPPDRVDQRPRDQPGQLRAALRAPPRQGPPRV
jgi:hypothetical protein